MNDNDGFEEALEHSAEAPGAAFVVDLDGFEGPIDLLLTMARDQKVDITQIAILPLAEQYLTFIENARKENLELAADYLVMAAWLAYLKSRLLLPDLGTEEEPSGEEMAAALAFQLKRLEVMQEAGQTLMARARLGQDFFGRGQPEKFPTTTKTIFEVTLYDLLKAYGDQKRRLEGTTLHIEPWELYTVEDSIKRLTRLLGSSPDWQSLWQYLPKEMADGLEARSALASTFAATLELAREGKLELRQAGTFGPIQMRAANRKPEPALPEGGPEDE